MITEQTTENIFTFGFLEKKLISILEADSFDIRTSNIRNNINHNNYKIADLQNMEILVQKIVDT